MPAKISGIAVYPLQKFRLRSESLPEDKKYDPDNLIKVNSDCKFDTVQCKDEVNLRMEPRVNYQIVCAVKCDSPIEVQDYSVEGSVEKIGKVIRDYELQKRNLNPEIKDIKGFYRHWWDWNNHFKDWKETGRYDVKLRLLYKNDKIEHEITIPVTFTEANYQKYGPNIEP